MSDEEVRVLIKGADSGRPGIPLDVFGSIAGALGILYPNAKMGPGEWGNGVTLIVTPEDRRNTTKGRKRAIAAAHEPNEDGAGDVDVIGYEDGALRTTAPEEGKRILLEYGLNFLVHEGGPNYVEQRATLPDGRGIVFTVQWQDGESPTQQLEAAKTRLGNVAALADVDRLEGKINSRWGTDVVHRQVAQHVAELIREATQ